MSTPVEARFGEIAMRRMLEDFQKPVVFKAENPAMHRKVGSWPKLIPSEEYIRVDPYTGQIRLGSWRRRKLDPEKEDVDDVVLGYRGKNPQSIASLRFSNFRDIERAIRGSRHIYEPHAEGGATSKRHKLLTEHIETLMLAFKEGYVTLENLDEFVRETSKALGTSGYLTGVLPEKQEVVSQVSLALDTDSNGRLNSLISRTRLASAWLKVVGEKVVAKKIFDKYHALEFVLEQERRVERTYLEEAVNWGRYLANMTRPNIRFPRYFDEFRKNMVNRNLHPSFIRVYPYRPVALATCALLFGMPDDPEERTETALFLDRVTGDSSFVDELLANPSLSDRVSEFRSAGLSRTTVSFQNQLERGMDYLQKVLDIGEEEYNKHSGNIPQARDAV